MANPDKMPNNLAATPGWDDVPQWERNTPLMGGPGGQMNVQAQALLDRTEQARVDLSALQLADYPTLRTYTGARQSVYVTGSLVTAAASGVAGMFVLDDSDTTSADNGGTVIVAANGKRWKRVFSGDLYVTWFGAASSKTGAANAACVQAAINSLTGGGSIVFPNGDWPLDTVFVQNDRVNVRGEGDATLILTGNMDGIVVGVAAATLSFCDVTGLKFDRAAKSTAGAAVKMVNTAYSSVYGCKFRNSYMGIWVKTHNDSLLIERNHFYDGTYYGIYEYNQNETWANDLRITRNWFWHVEYAALYMSADGVGVASVGDTYFHHNVVVSSPSKGVLQTQYGVRVDGAGTYNTNIRVENNTMEGLRLQFIWMVGLNRSPVINNYLSGTGTNDVGLYYGGGIGNSQISLNVIIGFNSSGIYIYNTGGLTLQGNQLTSNVTLGGALAELTMQNVTDTIVDGNFLSSSSSRWGIDVTQNGSPVDNIIYSNNRFSKSGSNANYQYDIRHNNYGGNRVLKDNLGNDATSGKASAPPVSDMALQWYPGEKIENNTAAELGAASSKYIVDGWVCVAQGAPGTWVQRRSLTGN